MALKIRSFIFISFVIMLFSGVVDSIDTISPRILPIDPMENARSTIPILDWPSGAKDYFTLLPPSAQGDNVYRIAVIGDSIAWGVGLEQSDKYYYKVAETIRNQLNMPVEVTVFAHSGAVIKNPSPCLTPGLGCSSPTLMDQAKNINDDVDLILVSGGINDVGITNILDPSTPANTIDTSSKNIKAPMTELLTDLMDKTDAKIVVTGYYPIITAESKLGLDRGIALFLSMFSEKSIIGTALTATESAINLNPLGGAMEGVRGIMQKAADESFDTLTDNSKRASNSHTFYSISSDSLRSAVETADNKENRIVFVDPLFNDANSYRASDALLKDNIFDLRSLAHPTARGADVYADKIENIINSKGSDWLISSETAPNRMLAKLAQAGIGTPQLPLPTSDTLSAGGPGVSDIGKPLVEGQGPTIEYLPCV